MADIDRGAQKAGDEKQLSRKIIEMGGVKTYERVSENSIQEKTITMWMRIAPIDGRIYSLQTLRLGGVTDESPEMSKAVASFRFLTPPKPAPVADSLSPTDRTSEAIGSITAYIAMAGGAICYVVYLFRKDRNKAKFAKPPPFLPKPPSTPPPLPPGVK